MTRYPDGSSTVSELADLRWSGSPLMAHCVHRRADGWICAHSAELDLEAMIRRLGEHFLLLDLDRALRGKLKCAACGHRDARIFLGSPPHRPIDEGGYRGS